MLEPTTKRRQAKGSKKKAGNSRIKQFIKETYRQIKESWASAKRWNFTPKKRWGLI